MAQSELLISYDGVALRGHLMDVKDLAPALLAIGELFEDANRFLNGNDVRLKIQVKALEAGSFGINIQLLQSNISSFTRILTGETLTSLINLKEIILGGLFVGTITYKGLYGLIRALKGGWPDSIKNLKNGYIEMQLKNETFIVPEKLLSLYKEESIRKSVEKTLEPLEKDGIDTFKIIEKGNTVEEVSENELQLFKTPHIGDEKIVENEHESAYSIVSLAFKENNKWRLHDGNGTISVVVRDDSFLKDVELNRISFSKGDILICKVKTTQFKTSSGLKTEHELLRVTKHEKAGRQLDFFNDMRRE